MIYNEEAQLWLPEDSVKMDRCWRFIKRNVPDLDAGIAWTKKKGIAVQAGGHVGIFPNYLAKHFREVITFEPDPDLYECLLRNRGPNVRSVQAALTTHTHGVRFHRSIGGTGRVASNGALQVQGIPLDSSGAGKVNFIHLDVEGHEVEALRGAALIIEACSPVLQLEVLPRFRDAIYEYVERIGYRIACNTCRDHVFVRA
jgi:FkbM family methyltransferase